MSANADLAILIRVRDEATAGLRQVQAQVSALGRTLPRELAGPLGAIETAARGASSGLGILGSAAGGLTGPLGLGVAAATALGAGLVELGRMAADEQVGIARLQAALAAQGISYADQGEQIEALIHQRERLAYSDDQQRDALAELVRHTHSLTEAEQLEAVAMDVARGKNMDLLSAATLVGRVHDGNVTILKRYGIAVRDGASGTEALAAVQQQFAGQAAAYAETSAGAWQRFDIELQNVGEDLGQAVLPAMTRTGGALADLMDALQDTGGLEAFASALSGALNPQIDDLAQKARYSAREMATLRQAIADARAEAARGPLPGGATGGGGLAGGEGLPQAANPGALLPTYPSSALDAEVERRDQARQRAADELQILARIDAQERAIGQAADQEEAARHRTVAASQEQFAVLQRIEDLQQRGRALLLDADGKTASLARSIAEARAQDLQTQQKAVQAAEQQRETDAQIQTILQAIADHAAPDALLTPLEKAQAQWAAYVESVQKAQEQQASLQSGLEAIASSGVDIQALAQDFRDLTAETQALNAAQAQLRDTQSQLAAVQAQLEQASLAVQAQNLQADAQELPLKEQLIRLEMQRLQQQQAMTTAVRQTTDALNQEVAALAKRSGLSASEIHRGLAAGMLVNAPDQGQGQSPLDKQIADLQTQIALIEKQKELNQTIAAEQTSAAQQQANALQQQQTTQQAIVAAIQAQIDKTNGVIDAMKPIPDAMQQALDQMTQWGILTSQQRDAIGSSAGVAGAIQTATDYARQYGDVASAAMHDTQTAADQARDAVNSLAAAFRALASARSDAAASSSGGSSGSGTSLGVLGFASGGVVPGPLGAARLAVVHGGETVLPAGRGQPSMLPSINVTVTGNQISSPADEERLAQRVAQQALAAWRSALGQGSRAVNSVTRP
jgi:hypothetical protein